MGNIFAGSEIVELGIQIEKNGRDFYEALAVKSKNASAGKIFKYLAAEEEKHIAVFQKILEGLTRNEQADSYPGEYLAYMNALASEHIFTQKNKGILIAKEIQSDSEAIERGIGFEKDSIIFYEGMKRIVPAGDVEVVKALIAQEQNHLLQLSGLKQAL